MDVERSTEKMKSTAAISYARGTADENVASNLRLGSMMAGSNHNDGDRRRGIGIHRLTGIAVCRISSLWSFATHSHFSLYTGGGGLGYLQVQAFPAFILLISIA